MRGGPGRYISIFALLFCHVSFSQEIQVKGGFVEDSLYIGQEINYWISATYPPALEMIFPDSNASFSPFEFSSKTYFPTVLKGDLAFDSTIYTLQSFEIEKVQHLQLESIVLAGADSTILTSPRDSIFLSELALAVSDTTKLKTNLDHLAINRQFNYPLLYYILGGLALIVLIVLAIFGRKILKYLKVKKMERDYQNFSEVFSNHITLLKESPEPETAEKALSLWKKYQQRLDKIGFTSFTTTDILALDFTQELKDPLKSIDRVVYGRRIQDNVYQDFQQIEDFTGERFQKKVAEIRHEK